MQVTLPDGVMGIVKRGGRGGMVVGVLDATVEEWECLLLSEWGAVEGGEGV